MLSPREHATPFNKSPIIRALSMILMVVTIFSVLIRVLTRLATVRRLKWSRLFKSDDIIVFVSMVFVIAQSVAVYTQGASGLGKVDVSPSQTSSIMKSQLVSDILFFLALSLSKFSATTTVYNMSPSSHKRILPIQVIIAGWALSAIMVRAFACSLPSSWDYVNGKCINLVAFWAYVDIANIFTDLLITAITIQLLVHLQMPLGTKAVVVGVFGSRLVMIPPAVCHIYYYKQAFDSSSPIFDMWMPSVIIQVIQCVGITTTCIPFWMRFLKGLESGQMGAGDIFGALTKSSNSRSAGGTNTRGTATGTKSRIRVDTTTTVTSASRRAQAFELTSTQGWQGSSDVKKFAHVMTDHGKSPQPWDPTRQNSQEALVDPSTTGVAS
ncbi:hypothetical protein F53441_12301 [Fusarium austroafricanum]|uniref:Rhodopsin domain-containing protein n=1 Tax=Fusarium austroafricanum TaxID=2364996 RepID=A0A8H4K059_9HYPO|nr:hypothetical protein F53441_12301 [Fusarium austroafricanum]